MIVREVGTLVIKGMAKTTIQTFKAKTTIGNSHRLFWIPTRSISIPSDTSSNQDTIPQPLLAQQILFITTKLVTCTLLVWRSLWGHRFQCRRQMGIYMCRLPLTFTVSSNTTTNHILITTLQLSRLHHSLTRQVPSFTKILVMGQEMLQMKCLLEIADLQIYNLLRIVPVQPREKCKQPLHSRWRSTTPIYSWR